MNEQYIMYLMFLVLIVVVFFLAIRRKKKYIEISKPVYTFLQHPATKSTAKLIYEKSDEGCFKYEDLTRFEKDSLTGLEGHKMIETCGLKQFQWTKKGINWLQSI